MPALSFQKIQSIRYFKIRKIAEQLRKQCMPATCCWVAKCCGAATCCGAVEGVPFGFRGRDNWNFVSWPPLTFSLKTQLFPLDNDSHTQVPKHVYRSSFLSLSWLLATAGPSHCFSSSSPNSLDPWDQLELTTFSACRWVFWVCSRPLWPRC